MHLRINAALLCFPIFQMQSGRLQSWTVEPTKRPDGLCATLDFHCFMTHESFWPVVYFVHSEMMHRFLSLNYLHTSNVNTLVYFSLLAVGHATSLVQTKRNLSNYWMNYQVVLYGHVVPRGRICFQLSSQITQLLKDGLVQFFCPYIHAPRWWILKAIARPWLFL